jgi:hypothetical protein
LRKTLQGLNFSFHLSGIPLPIEEKTVGQGALGNEEWEKRNELRIKELLAAVELKSVRLG